jgi:DNA-binding Lrp family transcriptional regulator
MGIETNDLDSLRQWASPRQLEYIDAILQHGGQRAAARVLGVSKGSISNSLKTLRKRAVVQGFGQRLVPEPHIVKGHSMLDRIELDGTVTPLLRWTKTSLDEQKWLEAVKEAVQTFVEDVAPIPAPVGPSPDRDTDIIPWINIGDAHLAMLASEVDTNANFDMKIAERELCTAIFTLIDEAEEHDRCVIQDLGDFTHTENARGETEASGHRLDVDGRYHKMIKVYSRIMRRIVDKALSKFNHVDVIINQGNHSRKNDWWMSELLTVAYGHTDRVHVLKNGNVFIGYRMGKTLVVSHHSDKCKPAVLPQVVATDFAIDWGETVYRYVDIGHIHHSMKLKEAGGCTVESFNTLAPTDLYAHDGGWRSRQSITLVLRSRTYGEVGRRVLPIERVRDLIDAAASAADVPHYRPPERRAYAV